MRSARVAVLARAHWVNAWVLVPFARPFLRWDGRERPLAWGRPTTFDVGAGHHVLQTFWRYRGTSAPLGTGTVELDVGEGEEVLVLARNGPLNAQPLRPRALPATSPWPR